MHPLLIALCLSILINFIAFLIAYKKQTDHLTDATYSLTFIVLACYFLFRNDSLSLMKVLLATLICVWAIRLGSYLFMRIRSMGVDKRFDEMRPHWNRYIKFWILQAVSVWIIAIPFILGLTYHEETTIIRFIQVLGLVIWLLGFIIETLADYQKSVFKNKAGNQNMFMSSGLFSIIKYPNYLGEIMVWVGIFIYVLPLLSGLEYLAIVSPVWIIVLLLFISGIPLLKKQADKKYGHLEAYQVYSSKTKKLLPFLY